MKSSSERREGSKRKSIKVLVKCLPPGVPTHRNGHETLGWNMWASNITDDGVGLHWSKDWAALNCIHCLKSKNEIPHRSENCLCRPPNETLKEGHKVHLDGLIYTEKGSEPMEGHIRWVRLSRNKKQCDLGIFITSPEHRQFFKALLEI